VLAKMIYSVVVTVVVICVFVGAVAAKPSREEILSTFAEHVSVAPELKEHFER
jgi:outer membrane lipoprotein-sorting protein